MAKFNSTMTRPATFSPVQSEKTPSGRTHEGGAGYARDTKSELFLLAVANMVGEKTFYEGASARDDRFVQLVHKATREDPEWTAGLLRWLRSEGNMRSASLVGAAEFAKARLDAGEHGLSRQVVASVLQRADEPGEMLAYWTSTYGRAVPKPVKRGVADAAEQLYSEFSYLKYDSDSRGFRMADVLDLTHPAIRADWQGDLFKYILDQRHGNATEIPESLKMLRARAAFAARRAATPEIVFDPDELRAAGMTWENVLSMGVSDKRAVWEAVIPTMGYMALLRNLRNFDQAGVSDEVASKVAERLADPEQVARSRQFPMRFLSAYKAAPSLRWSWPLEKALNLSLSNVPCLNGRTLVLVDMSGSMGGSLSAKSDLSRAEAAAMFGSAVALRCETADLVQFGTSHAPVTFKTGESVLKVATRFTGMGGTNTAEAVRANLRADHKRVLIVTDEQAWGGWHGSDPTTFVNPEVAVYTWNLAGYQRGHGPSGSGNRHTFGGLTDAAFRMVPLLEAGRDATWPWLAA